MAFTAPRTWVVGELVTAAIQNTFIRDNQLYLIKKEITVSPEATPTMITQHAPYERYAPVTSPSYQYQPTKIYAPQKQISYSMIYESPYATIESKKEAVSRVDATPSQAATVSPLGALMPTQYQQPISQTAVIPSIEGGGMISILLLGALGVGAIYMLK